jgi:hypothetical protein
MFEGAWWVSPGRVLAGPHPAKAAANTVEARVGALLDAGIRTFVDLTEPHEESTRGTCDRALDEIVRACAERAGREAGVVRASIVDESVPGPPTVARVQAAIASALAGGPVYLHCWSGGGRSHVAAGIHLVAHEAFGADECLTRILKLRVAAGLPAELPVNVAQRVFLQSGVARVRESVAGRRGSRPGASSV